MHEMSLMNGLIHKLQDVAREQGATRVVAVKVRLGALSHFTEAHFRDHFDIAARDTIAAGARLELELMTDESDPNAQGVLLERIEVDGA